MHPRDSALGAFSAWSASALMDSTPHLHLVAIVFLSGSAAGVDPFPEMDRIASPFGARAVSVRCALRPCTVRLSAASRVWSASGR